MKKIAILHYAYPPNIGGVENLLREHAMVLVDLGYSVKVLTGNGQENDKRIKFVEHSKLEAIRVFDPEMQDKIENSGSVMEDFHTLSADIQKILDKELADCDVVIIHNVITLIHNLAFNLAFRKWFERNPHKKLIIWTHDHKYITEEKVKPDLPSIYHTDFVNELLTKPIEKANYVVVSEVFKNLVLDVMKLDSDQVTVIPAGVDVKSFIGAGSVLWSWLLAKNIGDKFPIFFSPSNILERKNIDYGLDILSEIKKTYPDSIYIISGKTSAHRDTAKYRLRLEQKIDELGLKDSVFFLAEEFENSLGYDDVKALYRLSDGVFYFSKSENFGIPIIESAIFKTHIFASNLQVFKEIAGDHEIEYIDYQNVSPADAAKRILSEIDQSKLIKLTSDMRKKYNLHVVLEKHLVPLINK